MDLRNLSEKKAEKKTVERKFLTHARNETILKEKKQNDL